MTTETLMKTPLHRRIRINGVLILVRLGARTTESTEVIATTPESVPLEMARKAAAHAWDVATENASFVGAYAGERIFTVKVARPEPLPRPDPEQILRVYDDLHQSSSKSIWINVAHDLARCLRDALEARS